MSDDLDLASIPAEILAEIREGAKAEWPSDREMQDYYIDEEAGGYLALQAVVFGDAELVKDSILAEAVEFHDTWDDRASFVQDEVAAYIEIQSMPPEDIPANIFNDFKKKAAAESDWYSVQLEDLKRAIDGYRYIQRTREQVGPIRELLVRMETIVGQECYNGNIQNYSSWGEWDGEGRSFRYPVTFVRRGEEEKRKSKTADLEHDELVTGHYKFGANELSIYRALMKIVNMLETEYDFVKPKAVE
jgi:hypothetical protein